jgi:CpeT protein
MYFKQLLVLLVFILSCNLNAQNTTEHLLSWMQGSFTSAEQAKADTNYFEIELEMVSIWTDREDGPWLYVEQAVASYKSKPYRQRVYQLVTNEDGKYESVVWSLKNQSKFAGQWNNKKLLDSLTPDSLTIRKGCSVILDWNDKGYYEGSTFEDECESNLRGATYATSEVIVKEDRILSWDRGFNEKGEQVWGAEKGGYIFIKK